MVGNIYCWLACWLLLEAACCLAGEPACAADEKGSERLKHRALGSSAHRWWHHLWASDFAAKVSRRLKLVRGLLQLNFKAK